MYVSCERKAYTVSIDTFLEIKKFVSKGKSCTVYSDIGEQTRNKGHVLIICAALAQSSINFKFKISSFETFTQKKDIFSMW